MICLVFLEAARVLRRVVDFELQFGTHRGPMEYIAATQQLHGPSLPIMDTPCFLPGRAQTIICHQISQQQHWSLVLSMHWEQ